MNESKGRVFVVDDDPAVLRVLWRLLEFDGFTTETFRSGCEFLEHVEASVPGCAILDLAMPELDGLEVQKALMKRGCLLSVIFLSGQADVPTSVQAMKHGASDLLEKPVSQEALLEAVRRAVRKSEVLQRNRQEVADVQSRYATLTPREREVYGHLLAGQLNKQIAAALGVMECTVKAQRAQVMRKMQAPTMASLIRLAMQGAIAPHAPPLRGKARSEASMRPHRAVSPPCVPNSRSPKGE